MDTLNPYRDASAHEARTGRIVVVFSLIGWVTAAVYSALYIALELTLAYVGCLCALVAATINLHAFRRTGNFTRAAHALGGCVVVAVLFTCWATGGVASRSLPWFLGAPTLAGLVAGRRVGTVWLGIVASTIALMYGLDLAGFAPSIALPARFAPLLDFVVPVGLIGFIFTITWTYEVAREEAESRLASSRHSAEVARDEAEQANVDARTVLDNVEEGLLLLDQDGVLQPAHSAAIETNLGVPEAGTPVWDYIGRHAPAVANAIELGWEQLGAGWLPYHVALDQLPRTLEANGRTYSLSWKAAGQGGHVLLVANDVTDLLAAERERAEQEELVAITIRLAANRALALSFVSEAQRTVDLLSVGRGSIAQERRLLHTLKGNCSLMGLGHLANWIHDLESEVIAGKRKCTEHEREALRDRWSMIAARIDVLVDRDGDASVTVSTDELESTLQLLAQDAPKDRIAARMESWGWDDAELRLSYLGEQAKRIAQRLNKPMDVFVDGRGVRTPPTERWRSLWASLVHLVRNAVDHGFESDRSGLGKPPTGLLELLVTPTPRGIRIEIADDGAGVDWDALEAKAGRPLETAEERTAWLLSDGATSRGDVTQLSGRGLGTAAVREAVEALGGTVEVLTERGEFTRIHLTLPTTAGTPGLRPVEAHRSA